MDDEALYTILVGEIGKVDDLDQLLLLDALKNRTPFRKTDPTVRQFVAGLRAELLAAK